MITFPMNPRKRLLPILLTLTTYCASAAAASAVTITSNSVEVSLISSAGAGSSSFTGTSIPTDQLLDVTQGEFYSRNQISYTGSGDNVTLLHTLSQKRSGDVGNYSQAANPPLFFTVAADTTYKVSGVYNVRDVETAGFVYLYTHLFDFTTFTRLAFSSQISRNTVNESFVMGENGGDQFNENDGSLTGSLLAGHEYLWYLQVYTYADDTDGGATATGNFRLDIGGGALASVPDGGATSAMFGLTVLLLAAYRRTAAHT